MSHRDNQMESTNRSTSLPFVYYDNPNDVQSPKTVETIGYTYSNGQIKLIAEYNLQKVFVRYDGQTKEPNVTYIDSILLAEDIVKTIEWLPETDFNHLSLVRVSKLAYETIICSTNHESITYIHDKNAMSNPFLRGLIPPQPLFVRHSRKDVRNLVVRINDGFYPIVGVYTKLDPEEVTKVLLTLTTYEYESALENHSLHIERMLLERSLNRKFVKNARNTFRDSTNQ